MKEFTRWRFERKGQLGVTLFNDFKAGTLGGNDAAVIKQKVHLFAQPLLTGAKIHNKSTEIIGSALDVRGDMQAFAHKAIFLTEPGKIKIGKAFDKQ
jgi:hypothetical protein